MRLIERIHSYLHFCCLDWRLFSYLYELIHEKIMTVIELGDVVHPFRYYVGPVNYNFYNSNNL